jgi:hypothetical protein
MIWNKFRRKEAFLSRIEPYKIHQSTYLYCFKVIDSIGINLTRLHEVYKILAASSQHPVINFSDLWLYLKDNVHFQVVFTRWNSMGERIKYQEEVVQGGVNTGIVVICISKTGFWILSSLH